VAIPQNFGFSAIQGTGSRFSPGEGNFAGLKMLSRVFRRAKENSPGEIC
jgi:hypothetical protein